MSIMFAWRKKSNVGGGRIHYITNESGAKLSKSMRCIYYRDDGEDGGSRAATRTRNRQWQLDTNKNDGVEINEYHRDVDALDGMTYLCLLCPL